MRHFKWLKIWNLSSLLIILIKWRSWHSQAHSCHLHGRESVSKKHVNLKENWDPILAVASTFSSSWAARSSSSTVSLSAAFIKYTQASWGLLKSPPWGAGQPPSNRPGTIPGCAAPCPWTTACGQSQPRKCCPPGAEWVHQACHNSPKEHGEQPLAVHMVPLSCIFSLNHLLGLPLQFVIVFSLLLTNFGSNYHRNFPESDWILG